MARYRRYRRTIIRAPRKKWASNMIPVDFNVTAVNEGTQEQTRYAVSAGTTLAENKSETSSPTPVIVKTGNFRAQFDVLIGNGSGMSDMTVFVIYCPEGINPIGGLALRDFMLKHPEWVIAWRKVDLEMTTNLATQTNSNRITINSRLKRNLNSGDKINVYMYSTLGVNASTQVRMSGMVQFWTCAN